MNHLFRGDGKKTDEGLKLSFLSLIWQQLSPAQCLICHQSASLASSLCDHCIAALPLNQHPCRLCATPMPADTEGLLCGNCLQNTPAFDHVFSPFLYQRQIIPLIHQYKFKGKLFLCRSLSQLFLSQIRQYGFLPDKSSVLVPVPLHRQRLLQRGYNQAAELAVFMARELALPMQRDLIERTRSTISQLGLNARERQKNIRKAFVVNPQRPLPDSVILVDDVMTTGATVNEIARCLKQKGCSEVIVWALARA